VERLSPESSAIVLLATGVAATGAGTAAGGGDGAVVTGAGVAVFDSLGSQASSSNPSTSFFPFRRPLVAATAVGEAPDLASNAFSSTASFAGFAGVGLVFFVVLSRRAPPGPLNNPPGAEASVWS
jgi:hypothetical protein